LFEKRGLYRPGGSYHQVKIAVGVGRMRRACARLAERGSGKREVRSYGVEQQRKREPGFYEKGETTGLVHEKAKNTHQRRIDEKGRT